MQWLGNYKEGAVVHFLWSTNKADGSSATRTVNGEIIVYRDNGDPLTVAEFQTNPATGTFASPANLNDNNVAQFTEADALDEYCEVEWGADKFISCFRHHGDYGAPFAGKFKIQHWDGSQWVDNTIDIDCMYYGWSSWISLTIPIVTNKIRVVCTNILDGGENERCPIGELELKGVPTTAGVTDTEDFDNLTGIHACTIDLGADAFYAVDADYSVVLQGATIDGKEVNSVLAHFSIEKRANKDDEIDRILTATEIRQFTVNDATATTTKFITTLTETPNTFWPRAAILSASGNNKGQIRAIKTYNGSTKEVQLQTPLSYAPADGDSFVIVVARKFLTPDIEGLALESTLTAIKGNGWTDETLKAIKDALDAEVGPGGLSCTWTQKDDDENPMDNVQIWISTDEAGVNVIAGTLLTNASGQATFMLDAGTYYVWREKAGYNFTNPQEWSVS